VHVVVEVNSNHFLCTIWG